MRRALCLAFLWAVLVTPSLIADDTGCGATATKINLAVTGNGIINGSGTSFGAGSWDFKPGETLELTKPTSRSIFVGVEVVQIVVGGEYHGHENLLGTPTPFTPTNIYQAPEMQYSTNCLKVSESLKPPAEAHLKVWYRTDTISGSEGSTTYYYSYYVDVYLDLHVTIDIQWRGQKAPRASQDNTYSMKLMELDSNVAYNALQLGSNEEADFRWAPTQSSLSAWTFMGMQITGSSPELDPLSKITTYVGSTLGQFPWFGGKTPPKDLLDPSPPGNPLLFAASPPGDGSQVLNFVISELDPTAGNMTVRADYVLWFYNQTTDKWFYIDPELDIDLPCTNEGG